MSEINVTPMVDVMLVLLIIFMVTAPLIQQGVAVELPTTRAQPLDVQENRLVLSINDQKQVYLGETEIAFADLREKLVGNIRLRADKQIYLHADHRLPYGFVVDVMAIMKEAGVENLGMVTDPMQPNAPRSR